MDRNVSSPLPTTIYTPESRLTRPLELLNEVRRDVMASKELAWQLFYRNIRVRYRQSALGPLWAFIPPILVASTATVLRQGGVIASDDTGIPYALAVLFKTILWQTFATSLGMPLRAMKLGMPLLRTIRVPVEGLVLAAVYEMLFDLIIQLVVLAGVFVMIGAPLSWGVIPAIGAFFTLICFGFALGLFLVPLGSLYTDVNTALPFITRFWFFLTPILYTPPSQWPYSLIVDLNPVTPLLLATIDLSIEGTLNNPVSFTVVSILSFILLITGWVFYRISIPMLVERSG
ncbi:MAG: ABC transporter permease [Leptolyngbyaceae bacterium]|nr:ABC transporter permease [Leptolyngbyaceae bacterium]